MEYENERVLKLIFPNEIPSNLQDNPELLEYLLKLGAYKVDQLKKEESRLSEEKKAIVEQTQDLAISNYKTFILTSECSREIFREFKETETKLNNLIEKLPNFSDACDRFINTSGEINSSRRLNSLTLKRNAQLLEILELPQLMDTCIRAGKYEEALELASYVQRMGVKHGNIPIITSIVNAIEGSWHTMLTQLLTQLRTDLQLPKCLQVVGYLRRMQAFSTSELKLKFLQARDSWLNEILAGISTEDPQQHLTKTIELTRINLFNIITQYKAIFSDEDTLLTASGNNIENRTSDCNKIFYSWLHEKIDSFLQTLEVDLLRGVNSIDTVLGQCMYFGLSFSRVGADFRGLMAPIFVKIILQQFNMAILNVTRQFEADIDNYTLINKITSSLNRNKNQGNQTDNYSPPESLLDFHPLANYCNGLLTAFNELRLCSPIAIADSITKSIQASLEKVAKHILGFYRQEQQAFSGNERDNFVKFCSCFAFDLIPYIQRCIHVLFPTQVVATHLGINIFTLQKEGFLFLKTADILKPLENLLPDKVDAIILQAADKTLKENTESENINKNNENLYQEKLQNVTL